MVLHPDFSAFVALLNAHEVRYLVVGGYAVAFHGHPRYTKDLDVWVDATPDNATRLMHALEDFGFGEAGLDEATFLNPDKLVMLGRPPTRIDLLTSIKGVTFAPCFEARVTVLLDDTPVHFIDLPHLKKAKRATGRHQDLADLENLE